jgi:large subunit ribosomal protein L19e
MDLSVQKRIAADILKCGVHRVIFEESAAARIKEAITKADMRTLVKQGVVGKEQKKGISRVRANKRLTQRRLGRQQGSGTRKGRRTARIPDKQAWMAKVRTQRALLKEYRASGKITQTQFVMLYKRVKGDYFRSKRHINMFLEEEANK